MNLYELALQLVETMNHIKPSENSISEVEAIYKIVIRNLQPHNYAQLFPEAQPVILQEVETLLLSPELSTHQKQLLFDSLESLKIEDYQIPFKIVDEFQREKTNSNIIKAF